MNYAIDFKLSKRYSAVERTIFLLVINGLSDISIIQDYLRVFSNEVLANSIRNLVNFQLLNVDLNNHTLYLSSPIVSLIDACDNKKITLDLPDSILEQFDDGVLLISGRENQHNEIKKAILSELLPGADHFVFGTFLDYVLKAVD